MATRFGKYVRKLRIDRDLTLKDLADSLKVSSAFLSAVERGSKAIPTDFGKKVSAVMDLNPKQEDELNKSIELSQRKFELNVNDMTDDLAEFSVSFARKASVLTQDQVRKLRDIIDGE